MAIHDGGRVELFQERAKIVRQIPLGRMGDCQDDIGRAVAALVSDDLSYLTGATLMLDGGLCIKP